MVMTKQWANMILGAIIINKKDLDINDVDYLGDLSQEKREFAKAIMIKIC